MRKDGVGGAKMSSALQKNVDRIPTDLRVKLVPRLGPFAVSRASKNDTALAAELNVIDSNPP